MKPHGKRYRRNRRLQETETAACFSLQQLFRSGPLFGHVILVESGLRLLAQTDVNDHRHNQRGNGNDLVKSGGKLIGGRIRRSKNRKFVVFGKRRDRSRHPTVIWSFVRRRAGNAPNPVVKSKSGKCRFPLFRLLNIIVVMLNIGKKCIRTGFRPSFHCFSIFRSSGTICAFVRQFLRANAGCSRFTCATTRPTAVPSAAPFMSASYVKPRRFAVCSSVLRTSVSLPPQNAMLSSSMAARNSSSPANWASGFPLRLQAPRLQPF